MKQATKSLAKINSELTTSATKLPAVSVFPFLLPNNKEFNKKKKKYKENLAWLSSLFAWRENPKDTTAYGRDEGVSDVNRVGTGNEITINHGEEIERELGYIEEKERVKCRLSRNRQWYDTPRLYLYTFETSKTNHAEEKKTLEFIYLRLLVALPSCHRNGRACIWLWNQAVNDFSTVAHIHLVNVCLLVDWLQTRAASTAQIMIASQSLFFYLYFCCCSLSCGRFFPLM